MYRWDQRATRLWSVSNSNGVNSNRIKTDKIAQSTPVSNSNGVNSNEKYDDQNLPQNSFKLQRSKF